MILIYLFFANLLKKTSVLLNFGLFDGDQGLNREVVNENSKGRQGTEPLILNLAQQFKLGGWTVRLLQSSPVQQFGKYLFC